MSHTINSVSGLTCMIASVTIINYATGGEVILPSEFTAVRTIDTLFFAQVPPSQNSLASLLFPTLESGKVKLYRFVSGSPVEIPATTALNAVVTAMVHVSGAQ